MRTHRKPVALAGLLLSFALVLTACTAGSEGDPGDGQQSTEKNVRVAVLTSGAVNDNGYNADAKRAADLIESTFGEKVALSESVPVATQSDVYRQFATQKYDLIIGWGGQFTDGAVEVSKEFPDVKFLVVNSNVSNGTNLASVDEAVEQWYYMAGWLQAKLSKSGTIGFVGAQCFDGGGAALIHGLEQGALAANPAIDLRQTLTGDYEDPTKANQAAQALIEKGADVLSGNLNNAWAGIYQAARAADDVRVITEWPDSLKVAPDVISSTLIRTQAGYIENAVRSVKDGTFKGELTLYPITEDLGPVIANSDLLDDALYNEALDIQAKIISGDITVNRDEKCA